MLASRRRFADSHWSSGRGLMHASKKRPVFGLFARCGRTTPLTAARSLSFGHCRIGTGEKFASCLTAYRSGFELPVATAIKCRLSPASGHGRSTEPCPVCARRRHRPSYSITSSARLSRFGDSVSPKAFAVLRLTTSRNLVASSTGRSAGFRPLRILSMNVADCR